MKKNSIRKAFVLAAFVLAATTALAQSGLHKVNWRDARITDVGAYMMDLRLEEQQNAETQQTDTTIVNRSRVVWESEGYDVTDIEQNPLLLEGESIELPDIQTGDEDLDVQVKFLRKGVRRIDSYNVDDPQQQSGNLKSQIFKNFYYNVFSFEYPSVDADGNPITLSAMCACPTKGTKRVNNIILGTHITITADRERPTAQNNNWSTKDWGMIFALAAGNKLSYKGWFTFLRYLAVSALGGPVGQIVSIVGDVKNGKSTANFNNDLVIMPDYEGYGVTKNRAHPYLYQELTARQCLDALLYGIALYESSPKVAAIRAPIRNNFRTAVTGYSQGGSVAMACHRFIEQNNLQKDLHFTGSYCGDGPYDPMATLMYYMKQDLAGKKLEMPVVLPLIIKGMLDSNPYMTTHKAEDYFSPEFLNCGIMNWLESKNYSTDDIESHFSAYGGILEGHKCFLHDAMNAECYAYFKSVYLANKNTYTSAAGIPLPTRRGVMEDLHFALASNNMTNGWVPKKKLILFHSEDDPVVPYDNALSAQNRLGTDKIELWPCSGKNHVEAGEYFFSQSSNIGVVLFNGLLLNDMINEICDRDY